jgi:nitrate/nitrite transporter NarK
VTPTLPAIYGDLFLGRSLGSIIGFINIGYGIGGALGPLLAGYIYDVTGEYTIGFVMVIAAILLGVVLVWVVGPRKVSAEMRGTLKNPSSPS